MSIWALPNAEGPRAVVRACALTSRRVSQCSALPADPERIPNDVALDAHRAVTPFPAHGQDVRADAVTDVLRPHGILHRAAIDVGKPAARRAGDHPHRLGARVTGCDRADMPYDPAVPYDEKLANRIRELVITESDLTEKKMFGGLAFLVGGNMAVAASGQGGALVRVDPAQSDTLVATTNARVMEMRGRRMRGWLRVDPEDLRTKRQLARWVKLGTTYARSLPVKR